MHIGEVVKSLKAPPITGWNKRLLWRGLVSSLCGVLLGMVISLVLNIALIEISVSKFFNVYFGMLFIATGGLIAWRVLTTQLPDEESRNRQRIFLGLAIFVSITGVVACGLQRSWFYNLPKPIKIGIYTMLGVSISFALIFSSIDLINIMFGLCQVVTTRSPVESAVQVTLIISTALLMGSIFGFMFGLMDVANEISYHVKLSLLKEEQLCYPIGGFIGGLAGFANEYLRNQEEGYIHLKRSEYESDI